jgi:hypothetical protein
VWNYTSLKALVEGREAPIELLPAPPPQDEDK